MYPEVMEIKEKLAEVHGGLKGDIILLWE